MSSPMTNHFQLLKPRHRHTGGGRRKLAIVGFVAMLAIEACGAGTPAVQQTNAPSDPAETTVSTHADTTVDISATTSPDEALALAEEFIDGFYSWDRSALEGLPWSENADLGEITYYQGWAEAGNYRVLDRQPCQMRGSEVTCDVTVEDDLIKALGLEFNVTDTFHLTIRDGQIESVQTSSDDPELVGQAFEWVLNEEPALLEGSCQGFFAGGPTPGECVKAIVAGFERFAASPDFPADG